MGDSGTQPLRRIPLAHRERGQGVRGWAGTAPRPYISCNIIDSKTRKKMITKVKELMKKYRQFLLYCIVGASNTLITWVVSYILTSGLVGWSATAASIPAYALGIINGYIWSTRTVFKAKGTVSNLTKFVLVNVLMIGLNFLLVWLFENQFGIKGFVSQVLATPFTFIGNYVLNKFWTFAKKKENI
jgi:putative flippase GtrA